MSYLSRIETERDELRATVSQLLNGWNRMVDDIHQLKQAKQEILASTIIWKERADKWAAELNRKEMDVDGLSKELALYKEDNFKLKRERDALESQMHYMRRANDVLRGENAELQEKHENLQHLYQSLVAKHDELLSSESKHNSYYVLVPEIQQSEQDAQDLNRTFPVKEEGTGE